MRFADKTAPLLRRRPRNSGPTWYQSGRLTDVAAIEKAVATAAEKFGYLDIVFANAGIAATAPVGKTSLGTLEQVLKINLTGVFFPIQVAAARTEKAVPRRQI